VIVVSDTSPINNLAAINHLHLLHQLYGTVFIPEAVYRELTDPNIGRKLFLKFGWHHIT
jgi:predicted nucleic acid-binding protein